VTPLVRQTPPGAAHTSPAVNVEFFPLATPSLVRQCAWCWLVMDGNGQYRIRPGHKIASATHGICPCCKEVVRAEIEGRPRTQPLLVAA
jgi:hypothetical protein